MKKIGLWGLFLLFIGSVSAQDIYNEISSAMQAANAKQIAVYFNTSVELTILNQEDVYSKAQAELLLKDFFTKNPPKTFAFVHKGSSKEGTLFAVGNLVTANGKTFRTSLVIKTDQGKNVIQQLRFEAQ